MEQSILKSVKKMVNVDPEDPTFDFDLIMHTNSVLNIVSQLGIGPEIGFVIQDADAKWEDFIGDVLLLNSVKTLVGLRVRLVFDPPATSFHIEALERQITELEVRLNIQRESTAWVDPNPPRLMIDPMDALMDGVY